MKKNLITIINLIILNVSVAQISWKQMTSMDIGRYAAINFTINGKAYAGLGQISDGTYVYDFYEYDPVTNKWTRKKNYPGSGSYAASAFVINGKGYVCLGRDNSKINGNDLWEYSPTTDTWRQRANFPGQARYGASAFVIGDVAYVGTGSYGVGSDYLFDMWMYNPSSDSWSRVSNFPGGKRLHATAFAIGNYGYLGTGSSNTTTATSDIWRYNKSDNTWSPIPNLPGTPRTAAVSFVIDDLAYVGTGSDLRTNYNNFYIYNPVTNSWSSAISGQVEFVSRSSGTGFSINNIGYVGTGYSDKVLGDLWTFGTDTISLPNGPLIRCDGGPPLILNAGDKFLSYSWSTGETSSSIQVTDAGWYYVTVNTSFGTRLSDSVEVKVDRPVVNLGPDLETCGTDSVILTPVGGGEFTSYLWTTPLEVLTLRNITAKKSGIYTLEATDKYGCKANDTIKLSFIKNPKLDLSKLDTIYCGIISTRLELSADKGSYSLERTDNGEIFSGLSVEVPNFGSYSFKFTATDSTGCFSDTIFNIGFHKIPLVDFSIDSLTCYHYNLSVEYIGDAAIDSSQFTWVFGGDTIAEGIGLSSQTVALGINRAKRDLTLKVSQDGCSNSDTIRDIKVIPNLDLHIADSIICADTNAEFISENTETVTYDWDYGDGSKERSDSHTLHHYNNTGYYNVSLKVTTDKGCTNEVRIDSMVFIAPIPTSALNLNSNECLGLGNHEVFYIGSGNQMDTYFWDLTAFDSTEIVHNPGNLQGPFIFNLKNKPQAPLKLNVVSKYGCLSDTVKITVKRIPDVSMNVNNNKGCIPLETGFEGIINDPVDQLFFTWDYGDGSTGSGDYTTHFYHAPDNKYNITLTALSSVTQCSDTIKMDSLVFVYPKPKADFSVDHSIVYNDSPDIQFLNQSQGATNYLWNFGDGATSIEENPLHKYQKIGYHNPLLRVYNDYQCMDTISHQVLVAFAKIFPPNAFSPNAPNPVDREFKLGQEAIKQEGYHLVILSRWEDIVFETKNEIKGWNGRMKNGNYAPAGTYVWVLDFIDFLGRTHRQAGTVTLLY